MNTLPDNLPTRFREICLRQGRRIPERLRRQHIDAWLADGTLLVDPDLPVGIASRIKITSKKAIRFLVAFAKHALDRFNEADEETQKHRRKVCRKCPLFDQKGSSCGACGCNLRMKTRWRTSKCPESKW